MVPDCASLPGSDQILMGNGQGLAIQSISSASFLSPYKPLYLSKIYYLFQQSQRILSVFQILQKTIKFTLSFTLIVLWNLRKLLKYCWEGVLARMDSTLLIAFNHLHSSRVLLQKHQHLVYPSLLYLFQPLLQLVLLVFPLHMNCGIVEWDTLIMRSSIKH